MKRLLIAALAAGLVFVQSASAQGADSRPTEHPTAAKKAFVFKGEPYLLATDPTGADLTKVKQPIKVDYEGRELRFASEETQKAFEAAPARYLALVDKAMIADQMPYYPMSTCPISGDKLGGSMGDAVDIIYKNRLVRFCCKMCIKKFKANPDKVIDGLNKAAIEQQLKDYPFKNCRVSDEELIDGETINVIVAGRLARICCKSCKKDLRKSPRFINEIDAARAEAAEHDGEAEEHGHGDDDDDDDGHGEGHGEGGHGDGHGDHDH